VQIVILFTKWEVHPRWRLREVASQDPYRRILEPKVATALRGRPKNTTQAVPTSLAVERKGQSVSRSSGRRRGRPQYGPITSAHAKKAHTAARGTTTQTGSQASISTQQQAGRLSTTLIEGKTTGVRCSGRRTQRNIRRAGSR
jgi:hypothetical protein